MIHLLILWYQQTNKQTKKLFKTREHESSFAKQMKTGTKRYIHFIDKKRERERDKIKDDYHQ